MALTGDLRRELAGVEVTRACCRKAEFAAVARLGGRMVTGPKGDVLLIEVSDPLTASRLRRTALEVFGHRAAVTPSQLHPEDSWLVSFLAGTPSERMAVQCGLRDRQGRLARGLSPEAVGSRPCDAVAVLRGALLAAGQLAVGSRSPDLAMQMPNAEVVMALNVVCRRLRVPVRSRETRGQLVMSFDEDGTRAVLSLVGADITALRWAELRTRQLVRRPDGRRMVNFDEANARRSSEAAEQAARRVERALVILGDEVPTHLLVAGKLRCEFRQESLEQLAKRMPEPTTKDGIAGRLRRLLALADRRADELGIPDTTAGQSPGSLAG